MRQWAAVSRRALLALLASCRFEAGRPAATVDATGGEPIIVDAIAIDAPLAVPAFVQAMDPGYSGSSPLAITLDVSVGDLLVAATYTSDLTDALSVADTRPLVWTSVKALVPTGCQPRLQMWYASVTAAGSDTVTVSQTGTTALGMAIAEYSGLATDSPIDTTVGAAASTTSSVADTGPIVTSQPDVLVALFADLNGNGTMTAGSGVVERGIDSGFYALWGDDVPGVAAGSHHLTAMLPTAQSDACWSANVVAFRIGTK